MPEVFSKEAYLQELYARLRDRDLRTSEDVHQLDAFRRVGRFVHYINGRIYDVLETRNTKENAYAAAYAWYPDEVTENYPLPEVDPETSITELQEDMRKVDKIRQLSEGGYVEGLKWIDKKTIRDCTDIRLNKKTIELHFADANREPVVLNIIRSKTFAQLCKQKSLTAQQVITFLQTDQFSVYPEVMIGEFVGKIQPKYLKEIIDWIEGTKLHDMYEQKFNTLIFLDALRRRYNAHQLGELDSREVAESSDTTTEVRDFMIDLVWFLDSIRDDEEEGNAGAQLDADRGSPGGNPVLLSGTPASAGDQSATTSELSRVQSGSPSGMTMGGLDTRTSSLPELFDVEALRMAPPLQLAGLTHKLLSHIYSFAHRVPAEHRHTLGMFMERAAALVKRLPVIFEGQPGHKESLRHLVTQTQQILLRMLNSAYFSQIVTGTVDFPDATGNFDVDEMLTHPKDFAQSQAYQLTGLLYYSWNADLGSLGYENIKMHNFLDGMIPDMRTKIIAAMQERKRLLDENEAIPRLGFRAEDA